MTGVNDYIPHRNETEKEYETMISNYGNMLYYCAPVYFNMFEIEKTLEDCEQVLKKSRVK